MKRLRRLSLRASLNMIQYLRGLEPRGIQHFHLPAPTVIRTSVAGLTLVLSTVGSAGAATWYVATTGSDNASCGTSGASCATVNYVLSNKVAAGDTVKIKPGTYSNQGGLNINNSTKHRNVTITADDQNNRPVLQNSSVTIAHGVSGVTISYLRIQRSNSGFDGYEGVIEVGYYPTLIDHNEIWNGNQGVFIRTSQQVTVSNNDIHHMGAVNTDLDGNPVLICNWNKDPVPSGFDNAIRVTGNKLHDNGGDGFHENSWSEAHVQFNYVVIDHNEIYNTQEQCIDTKGTDDVRIYNNDLHNCGYGAISNNAVYGSTERWEIYNNKIHDSPNFAIFDQGGGASWKIWNNLIYNNNTAPWYNLAAITLPSDGNSHFYHNTVYNNRPYAGINPNGNGNNVKNNIFWNNGTIGGPSASPQGNILSSSGTPSYNYVFPASPGVAGTAAVTVSDPALNNLAASDFSLKATSPVIDKGTLLAAPYNVDYFGVLRPQGKGVDIGAIEYGGTAVSNPEPAFGLSIQ